VLAPPLRRLTRLEYDNTVRDLLGDATSPGRGLPEDETHHGFNNNADVQGISPLHATGYVEIAEAIASRVDLAPLVPCKGEDDACAQAFVEGLGKRAFRRALRPEETQRLLAFFRVRKAEGGFEHAARHTIQLMLSAPQFLFRIEGSPSAGPATRLTPYETASRLSYLILGSMPDAPLFQAAETGKLTTADDVVREAKRLLDDPRARGRMRDFFGQWIEAGKILFVNRDTKTYTGFANDVIPGLLHEEAVTFVEHVAMDPDKGAFETLFTGTFSYGRARLLQFYGLPQAKETAATRDNVREFKTDPARFSGLLTHAGALAANALEDQTHPVYRGRWVRERFLCQRPPPPPPGVMAAPPEVAPGLPTRERWARHSRDAACSACHRLLDPIGFGFEAYGPDGRYRLAEGGRAIDASGEILDGADAAGRFTGVVELGKKLAASETVRECLATQLFRYTYGRAEHPDDRCALGALQAGFKAAGGNLRALVLAVVSGENFLYRGQPAPEGGMAR
jgi:hypothetical protein